MSTSENDSTPEPATNHLTPAVDRLMELVTLTNANPHGFYVDDGDEITIGIYEDLEQALFFVDEHAEDLTYEDTVRLIQNPPINRDHESLNMDAIINSPYFPLSEMWGDGIV